MRRLTLLMVIIAASSIAVAQEATVTFSLKGTEDKVLLSGELSLTLPTVKPVYFNLSARFSSDLINEKTLVEDIYLDLLFRDSLPEASANLSYSYETVKGITDSSLNGSGWVVVRGGNVSFIFLLYSKSLMNEWLEFQVNFSAKVPINLIPEDQLISLEQLSLTLSPELVNLMLMQLNVTSLTIKELNFSVVKVNRLVDLSLIASVKITNLTLFSEELLKFMKTIAPEMPEMPHIEYPEEFYSLLNLSQLLESKGNLSLSLTSRRNELMLRLKGTDEVEGPVMEYYLALQDYLTEEWRRYLEMVSGTVPEKLRGNIEYVFNRMLGIRILPSKCLLETNVYSVKQGLRLEVTLKNLELKYYGKTGLESRREAATIVVSLIDLLEKVAKDSVRVDLHIKDIPGYKVDERLVQSIVKILREASVLRKP